MDLPAAVFGDGLGLTSTKLETEENVVRSHQITRQDLSDGFVWGVDVSMGGGGILQARHFNGTIADARYFRLGNNSDAIQAAVDWVVATSEGRGVVLVPPIAGQWAITATITLASGVSIVGFPGTEFSLDANVAVFTIPDTVADILISGIRVDGNNRTADFISCGATVSRVRVEDCQVGLASDPAGTKLSGILLNSATLNESRMSRCTTYGGCNLVRVSTAGAQCTIDGNRYLDPKTISDPSIVLDLTGTTDLRLVGNRVEAWTATSTGPQTVLRIAGATTARPLIAENHFFGSREHQVNVLDGDFGQVLGNTFLNGGTAGLNHNTMDLNAAQYWRIHGNTISARDPSTLASAPANQPDFGLDINAGCTDIEVTANLFELITNAATPIGIYRCALAGLNDLGTNTSRFGNRYFRDQRKTQLYAAVTSGTVTANGFAPSGVRFAQYPVHQLTIDNGATWIGIARDTTTDANNALGFRLSGASAIVANVMLLVDG